MASANNWLGFSLSGQDNPQPNQNSSPAAGIDISGASDFYGLPTQQDSDGHLGVPGLRDDHTSYGIMEAFNRGPQETQGEVAAARLSPDDLLLVFVSYGAHYSMILFGVV